MRLNHNHESSPKKRPVHSPKQMMVNSSVVQQSGSCGQGRKESDINGQPREIVFSLARLGGMQEKGVKGGKNRAKER